MRRTFKRKISSFLKFTDRYVDRRQLWAIISGLAVTAVLVVVVLTGRGTSADQILISGKASVLYCTLSDGTDVCNPGSNVFSGSAESNEVAPITIIEDRPPTTPANLTFSLVGPTSFTLSWEASTDDLAVSSYILNLATDEAFANPVAGYADKDLGNVTTVTVTGLQSDKTYYARIRAKDSGGNLSSASNTVTVRTSSATDTQAPATPAKPVILSSTIDTVAVQWTATSDNVAVTGYRLDVATDSRFTQLVPTRDKQNVGNVTNVTINQLQDATTYYIRIYAYDAANNLSQPSEAVVVTTQEKPDTTAPTKPANLKAAYVSGTSNIKIEWSASTDNRGVAGYRIDVATDSEFKNFLSGFQDRDLGVVVQATVTNVDILKTHYVRVTAYDAANNRAESTTSVAPKADTTAPTKPANLKASYVGETANMLLEWSASTDDRGLVGYRLDIATDPQFSDTLTGYKARELGAVTQMTVLNLDTTKAYHIRITAYDAANNQAAATTSLPAKMVPQPVPSPSPKQPSPPAVSSVCFGYQLELGDRPRYVLVTVYDPAGGKLSTVRVLQNGSQLVINEPRFVGGLTDKEYVFIVKPDDHLAAKIVANPRSGCLGTNRKLYFGDIEGLTEDSGERVAGDNVIEPRDIVTVIRRRLQNDLPATAVVDVIRNRIRNANGESR